MASPTPTHTDRAEGSLYPHFIGGCALVLVFALSGLSVYAYFDTSTTHRASASAASAEVFTVVTPVADIPDVVASPAAASADPFASISLSGESALVFDETTGVTLYARHPDAQLPLASLTKVPLVLAALQVLPVEAWVTLAHDVPATSNTGFLPAGSRWRVKDLIGFTLSGSSNGGADALAYEASEPIRARFSQAPRDKAAVWLMNTIAQTHGGANMYFLNPSGLDESATQSGGYGTARAVATLFLYAARSAPLAFFATTQASVAMTSADGYTALANNTDEALDEIPGLVMGKTGFTDLAGGNLVVVFDTSGHRIVAVVLGSTREGRFSDMRTLVQATQAALRAPSPL